MGPQSSTAGQGMPDQGRKRAHLGPGVPAKPATPSPPSVPSAQVVPREESLELRSSVVDDRGPEKVTDGRP